MAANTHPGTYQLVDTEPPTTEQLECSVAIGSSDREYGAGGFRRIRTASVLLSKELHPARPEHDQKVRIQQEANDADDYKIIEFHEQLPDFWFIRCAQWE